MRGDSDTVAGYIAGVPAERRHAFETVRSLVRKQLGRNHHERLHYGMPAWFLPAAARPRPFASLASQKHHLSLYLLFLRDQAELDRWFHGEWTRRGGGAEIGRTCIRFRTVAELDLDLLTECVRRGLATA